MRKSCLIWMGYLLSKFAYMFLAIYVYSDYTALGDTERYLSGPKAWELGWYYNSTIFMDSLAGTFSVLLGDVLANVPFLLLSFFGVYYPVSRMELSKSSLVALLLILSIPNFGVWSSIASKESVSVFFMGIILGAYFDFVAGRSVSSKILFTFSLYLAAIFKPQYLIAIFVLWSYTYIVKILNARGATKFFLFSAYVFGGALVLFYFRDTIDNLSKEMPRYFRADAGSTRDNNIWVDQYDFFWNAAYGIYISFVGPTVSEAFSKPTHFLVWLESMAILFLGLCLLVRSMYVVSKFGRLNVMFISCVGLTIFWLLLVHYPFGALNPGSAIRYRASFFSFSIILIFYFYKRSATKYTSFGSPKYELGGS